jgi:predicted RNase H-like HicB family nuclease
MCSEYNGLKGRKKFANHFIIFIAMYTIQKMRTFVFPVNIEKDEDGFFAECPMLPGCVTQGDTYEEALANIKDAVRLYLEDMAANNEKIPTPKVIADLLTVEVAF